MVAIEDTSINDNQMWIIIIGYLIEYITFAGAAKHWIWNQIDINANKNTVTNEQHNSAKWQRLYRYPFMTIIRMLYYAVDLKWISDPFTSTSDQPPLHSNTELKQQSDSSSLFHYKCKLSFQLVVQQYTWLLSHWADLLGLVVMEDRRLIPPDKHFYTFQSLPLLLFSFLLTHDSVSLHPLSHTYTRVPTAWTSHFFLLLGKGEAWVIIFKTIGILTNNRDGGCFVQKER